MIIGIWLDRAWLCTRRLIASKQQTCAQCGNNINLPGFGELELPRRFLVLEPNARVLVFSMHAPAPVFVGLITASSDYYSSEADFISPVSRATT